jgi:hypothetical protein
VRKVLALVVPALVAAACGSSSKSSAASSNPVSGTIGGHPFTPTAVQAISAGTASTPCSVAGGAVTVGVKAVEIEMSSYAAADACVDLATTTCQSHKSSQKVTLLVAALSTTPPFGEPTLAPGTYTVNPDIMVPSIGATGPYVGYAEAIAPDPTCATTASAATGTIRLDQVGNPITGNVSLTFDNGGSLAGDFSASFCTSVSVDICARALGGAVCTQPADCVP